MGAFFDDGSMARTSSPPISFGLRPNSSPILKMSPKASRAVADRPEGKAMPRRYSRHYYDMYRLGHSFVLGRAVAQPGLLEQVVRFKEKLYRTPWAKLADARPGTLRLAPPKGRLDELAADYASMRPMLFGSYPSIDEIVAYMAELEKTINGLS